MHFRKALTLSIIMLSLIINPAFSQDINPDTSTPTNQTKENKTLKTNKKASKDCTTAQDRCKKIYSDITLNLKEEIMPVTLADSLKIALKQNFDIQSILEAQTRQKWLYKQQLATFLPDLTADYYRTHFNGDILVENAVLVQESGRSAQIGLNANWDIFTGFRRYFNSKETKNLYKSAIRRTDRTINQVLLDTTIQYYRLLQIKFNINVFKTALESAQEQLRINQQQVAAGTGTKFDVLRAQAEVASFSQLLIESQNNYRLGQAQLAQTMGINVFTLVEPCDEELVEKDLFKECFNLQDLVGIALKNQPDIDIAQYNLNATRARRNSAYSAYIPTISVRASENFVGFDELHLGRNQTEQIVATWVGGQGLGLYTFAGIKALNADVRQSKINKTITVRQVEQRVLEAYNRVNTSREVIKAAQREVESANESLRIALVRQQAGVGIYTDVLRAQETQIRAMVKYLNAVSDYNTNQAQLLYETGLISLSNLVNGFDATKVPPKEQKKK